MIKISIESLIKVVSILIFVIAVSFYIKEKGIPSLSAGSSDLPKVVTFDVIKLSNSQKAVASAFISKSGDVGRSSELLHNISERVRDEIARVAGKDTVVLIKQAVVQGQFKDITDEVLTNLKLPVNVPTSDGTSYAIDIAPTMFMQVPSAKPATSTSSNGSYDLP